MAGRLFIALSLALVIAGCGRVANSGINPFNWFGNSREVALQERELRTVADPRGTVAQVLRLDVTRTPGGAIISAAGLPPTQGYWAADLVPQSGEKPVNGVLSYTFRIAPPDETSRVGTQVSREVVAGRFVSDQKLEGVRAIRVLGAANALIARR